MTRISPDQWEAWREHPVTVAVMEHLQAEAARDFSAFTETAWEGADWLDDRDKQRGLLLLRCRHEAMHYLIDLKREDIDDEEDGDNAPEIQGPGEADPA